MNSTPASLVNARTGIIRELVTRPIPDHFPASFALTHAILSRSTTFSAWASDASGAGHAFADPSQVTAAAIGEAVERYCGNLVPAGLRRTSANELTSEGHPVVPLQAFALFSSEQYDRPGFPIPTPNGDTVLDWGTAERLEPGGGPGGTVFVPASMIWVSHSIQVRPARHPVIQAGLATGRSRSEAIWGALCEIIERDAMTLAWTGGRGVDEVTVPEWLDEFAGGPRGALTVRWFSFSSAFGLPVLGALVRDTTTGYLTLGMGVSADPDAAALKAYREALQLQLFVADLDDEDGPYMRAATAPGSPLKPWRADRCYADSYRPDLHDVIDYGCHLQLHLDPRIQAAFFRELDTSIRARVASSCLPREFTKEPDDEHRINTLVGRLSDHGLETLMIDVTTDDVAPTGLRTVRVLVPGMYSNAPHALPFLGGSRLGSTSPRSVPLPH